MIGWTTRPARREDAPALRALSLTTFPNNAEADLVDALLAGDDWIEGLSHVAEGEDGALVAYAILTRCHVGGAPAVALAPVAVRPDLQRLGAGKATIEAALAASRAAGEQLVITLRLASYYPRFGFAPASGLGISSPIEVGGEPLLAVVLDPTRPVPSGTVRFPAAYGVSTG